MADFVIRYLIMILLFFSQTSVWAATDPIVLNAQDALDKATAEESLSPPIADADEKILEKGEISSGAYIAGGIVGTCFTFGIGQAIQGRYSETGWIVTAGELGGVGLMLLERSRNKDSGPTYGFLGALTLIGFYAYDLVDLWSGPLIHNRRYRELKQGSEVEKRSSFIILPMNSQTLVAGFRIGL